MRSAELPNNSQVYGLTGGVASGKSTVSKFFLQLGIPVVDADVIAKELTAPGADGEKIYKKIFKTVDRKSIRKKILESSELKKQLESALHPLIRKKSFEAIHALAKQGCKIIIYDAALLFEAKRHLDFDGVILITSPREEKISRLIARDSVSKSEAVHLIDSQISDSKKIKHSKWIIKNDSDLESLKEQVRSLVEIFTKN